MSCATISAAVVKNCYLVGGLRSDRIWIGNEAEFTPASDATGVITGLVAVGGAKVYGYEGARNSVTYSTEQLTDGNTNLHRHTVNFRIMAYTADAKVQANKIAAGDRFFVIAQRNDGQYVLFGMGAVGTTTSSVNLIGTVSESNESGGGIDVVMTHLEGLGDISLPPTFLPTGGISAWMTANAVNS